MMNLLPLPDDIITEVLSRLPIESVVECKRVCKTWRSLIYEPAFGDAHTRRYLLRLDHSSSNSDADVVVTASMLFLVTKVLRHPNPYHRYVLTYEFECGNYISNADDDQMGTGGFKISKPPKKINISNKAANSYMYWKIVGSSNGLICLSSNEGVYVYNPCTSEYVNLGHPGFKTTSSNHEHYNLSGKGFGYDPSTNEYKVVITYYYRKEESGGTWRYGNERVVGEVSVCTLGSGGTWRYTEEEALCDAHRGLWFCKTPVGVLLSGALHWIIPNTDHSYHEIVSFDLAEEKFIGSNAIVMPSVLGAAAPSISTDLLLGLLGGCLCITHHNNDTSSSDIWVMNNMDKSWTMKFKISVTQHSFYDPIALLGNGRKILLRSRGTTRIVSYDIETGGIDIMHMADGHENLSDDILHIKYATIPYVRSIASLKAIGEKGAKKMHNDSSTLLFQPNPNYARSIDWLMKALGEEGAKKLHNDSSALLFQSTPNKQRRSAIHKLHNDSSALLFQSTPNKQSRSAVHKLHNDSSALLFQSTPNKQSRSAIHLFVLVLSLSLFGWFGKYFG